MNAAEIRIKAKQNKKQSLIAYTQGIYKHRFQSQGE